MQEKNLRGLKILGLLRICSVILFLNSTVCAFSLSEMDRRAIDAMPMGGTDCVEYLKSSLDPWHISKGGDYETHGFTLQKHDEPDRFDELIMETRDPQTHDPVFGQSSCVQITLRPDHEEAHLNFFTPQAGCFKNPDKVRDVKMGECLLRYTVQIMAQLHTRLPQIKKFTLEDASVVSCPPNRSYRHIVRPQLGPLLLMTKGYTFYGKQGFKPVAKPHDARGRQLLSPEQYNILTNNALRYEISTTTLQHYSDDNPVGYPKPLIDYANQHGGKVNAKLINQYYGEKCDEYANYENEIINAWIHSILGPSLNVVWNDEWEILF